MTNPHILLIFLDGIGLGEDDPETNPFAVADLPILHSLSNGKRWLSGIGQQLTSRALFIPTDPRMGVAGRPQSGSGQAAIVTGRNIPALIGEHYGPKPNHAIRDLLEEDNFFMRVVNADKTARLIEAYPPRWHKGINSGKRLPASYQYAARAAGIPFLEEADLRAGRAVSGDWTGEGWRNELGYSDTPLLTPYEAGVRMVEISRQYDFAFFPHWWTDVIGHRGTLTEAVRILERFNNVMSGVLDAWNDDEGFVIITSDHGNMEAMAHKKHTENDVPTVIIGEGKENFGQGLMSLADIVPRMETVLLG